MMEETTVKLLVIALMLIVAAYVWADDCCDTHDAMAPLTRDPVFVAAHISPEPLVQKPTGGVWTDIPVTAERTSRAYLVLPAEPKSKAAVIVIHEWWGLNDHIRLEAERISKDLKCPTIAIDLYGGKVVDKSEDAVKLLQSVNIADARATVAAAARFARNDKRIQASRVGVIGWCFGGGWSLQTAIEAGAGVQACVIYYGMPEKDAERLKKIKAPVLGIFAEKDANIDRAVVGEFEKTMRELGKPLTVHWFDAAHAFANPSNPRYDKPAADTAWAKAKAFLIERLRP